MYVTKMQENNKIVLRNVFLIKNKFFNLHDIKT